MTEDSSFSRLTDLTMPQPFDATDPVQVSNAFAALQAEITRLQTELNVQATATAAATIAAEQATARAISAPMAAPVAAPVVVQQDKNLLSKPPTYDGKDKTGYHTFVSQVRLFISGNPKQYASDWSKITLFLSLLRGGAYSHFEPYVDSDDKPIWLLTWKAFLDQASIFLGDPDRVHTITRRFRELRQTGTVASYSALFFQLAAHLGWNDSALQSQFFDGLKPDVRRTLIVADKEHLTVQDLANDAIRFDNRLQQISSGSHKDNKDSSNKNQSNNTQHQRSNQKNQFSGSPSNNSSSTSGPAPMDVDATASRRRGPLTAAMRKERQDKNLCLYCGEPNHTVSVCPLLAKKNGTAAGNATFTIADPKTTSDSKN